MAALTSAPIPAAPLNTKMGPPGAAPGTCVRNTIFSVAIRADPGKCPRALDQGAVELHQADLVRPPLIATARLQSKRQYAFSVESQHHVLQIHQRAREQSSSNEEDERQGHLSDNKRRTMTEPLRVPALRASPSFKSCWGSTSKARNAGTTPNISPVAIDRASASTKTAQSGRAESSSRVPFASQPADTSLISHVNRT